MPDGSAFNGAPPSTFKWISYAVALILTVLVVVNWVVDLFGDSPLEHQPGTLGVLLVSTAIAWQVAVGAFLRDLISHSLTGVAVEISTLSRDSHRGAQGPPGPPGPSGRAIRLPAWVARRSGR